MKVALENVSLSLGGVSILDGISLTADSGQFVGIVGPNGAGKTTLLRTINGVLTPDEGTVRVGGDTVADLSTKEVSRRVATVPQETHLGFDFTVRDVVEMGRHPHRDRFERATDDGGVVDSALDRAAVVDLADRSITEVSGGERQRVLLARALAQDAPVLVLDEPTASLDINHQVRTLELVAGLAEDGRTVLAAIHDLDLAARFCDELLLLRNGDVRATGPPASVLTEDDLREAFDTDVVVGRDPVTGSPSVTALSESGDEDSQLAEDQGASADD